MSRYLYVLLFTLVSLISHGQNTFNAGVIGGFTASQIHGDAIGGFDKLGVNAGAFVSTSITDNISSSLEIYYINKGSRKNATKVDPSFWAIRLNYLEIPLIVAYHYKKLNGEIGLSYGRLINQKFIANGFSYAPLPQRYFNKNEYGGILGVGYNFTNQLTIGVRYSQSIWKVRSFTFTLPRYFIFPFQAGSVNSVISVSLRYQFYGK